MKTSLPQGTRDFNAQIIYKRNFIVNTIKEVFGLYGFEPLETPSMENMETLLGKYGDEGDKLIFKILNNGLDNESKHEKARNAFEQILKGKNDKNLTERALRYDLTIPFARYVAMNFGQLTLPYKRFQIQPVWRADRPQKGRYREFYQCDADIAGTYSIASDAELALIYSEVFRRLKIPVSVRINNRKILTALAEVCQSSDQLVNMTTILDKMDKIGMDSVLEQMKELNLSDDALATVKEFVGIQGNNEERIAKVEKLLNSSEIGKEGVGEINLLLELINERTTDVLVDFNLARGLSYYTGTIYEVVAKNVSIGSIGGGGRYNDLTGLFGIPDVPGVGISFGLDRIYDVMEESGLFPEEIGKVTEVLFFNMGQEAMKFTFEIAGECRAAGIACEMYYEAAKLDKQFKYATKKNIPLVAIMGNDEIAVGNIRLKNIESGEQTIVNKSDLITFLQERKK